MFSGLYERLAATYSRRTYRTTTIGKTVFDGRVRNGIGSDHSFMATKNRSLNRRYVEPLNGGPRDARFSAATI